MNAEALTNFPAQAHAERHRPAVHRSAGEASRTWSACCTARSSCSHLPNRAELRLRSSGKVIGYTLSHVRDERGRADGVVALFQGPHEGRAARGARAASRSPRRARRDGGRDRARSEESAGRHRSDGRRAQAAAARFADAQSILTDIINEAKMANQIVHEALEFVRPIRLQVEHTSIADVMQRRGRIWPKARCRAATSTCTAARGRRAAADPGRPSSAVPAVHEPADQRLRGARRHRARSS